MNHKKLSAIFLSISSFFISANAESDAKQNISWSEGSCSSSNGISEGANRSFFNRGMELKWENQLGDWIDASYIKQGKDPYFSFTIDDIDRSQKVAIDTTDVAKKWLSGELANHGFFIANERTGQTKFASKEHHDISKRPSLLVSTNSKMYRLFPDADTTLLSYTYHCLGSDPLLSTKGPVLVRFDLSVIPSNEQILSSTLNLTTDDKQYGATHYHGYLVDVRHPNYDQKSNIGLSNGYVNDYTISWDNDVYFAEGFENPNWHKNWQTFGELSNLSIVSDNAKEKFVPISGKALQVKIPVGELEALNARYIFRDKIGKDLDEVYFRYYLRLGNSWQPNDSGKLPGIAGTYHNTSYEGGWGARKSNGENGWSARGLFKQPLKAGNNFSDRTPIGTYLYHRDQEKQYGDFKLWDGQGGVALRRNKWYLIEQRVKINSPGVEDGILESWVDGALSFRKNDIVFRSENSEQIAIDKIWLNVYHGGKTPIEKDSYLFLDNVVIAKSYIGAPQLDANYEVLGQEPNREPVISSFSPINKLVAAIYKKPIRFNVDAIDYDGDRLKYLWFLNDRFAEESSSTFNYIPSELDSQAQSIKVQVIDSNGGKSEVEWKINVDNSKWSKVKANQDTSLHNRSAYALGQETVMRVSKAHNSLIQFEIPDEIIHLNPKSVKLVLSKYAQYGEIKLNVFGVKESWSEGTGVNSGASRDFIDRSSRTPWETQMGDFYDSALIKNGSSPFASLNLGKDNDDKTLEIDITNLAAHQWSSGRINLLLKSALAGKLDILTSESDSGEQHPIMLIEVE